MYRSSPLEIMFTLHFLKIAVEVKSLGLSHVIKLRYGVGKGMLSIKYYLLEQILILCQSDIIEITRLSKAEVNLATIVASFNAQTVTGNDMACKRCEISTLIKDNGVDLFFVTETRLNLKYQQYERHNGDEFKDSR